MQIIRVPTVLLLSFAALLLADSTKAQSASVMQDFHFSCDQADDAGQMSDVVDCEGTHFSAKITFQPIPSWWQSDEIAQWLVSALQNEHGDKTSEIANSLLGTIDTEPLYEIVDPPIFFTAGAQGESFCYVGDIVAPSDRTGIVALGDPSTTRFRCFRPDRRREATEGSLAMIEVTPNWEPWNFDLIYAVLPFLID